MSTAADATPADDTVVRREVTVPVGVDEAFATFTGRFGEVKPAEHSLLDGDAASVRFDTHVGGTITDLGADGSTCTWARILAVDPPHRVVFSWDIATDWTVETDHDRTSEVEVRFTAVSPMSTRVEIEHRHLDRHGPGWPAFRDSVGDEQGWPLFLDRLAGLFAEPAPA